MVVYCGVLVTRMKIWVFSFEFYQLYTKGRHYSEHKRWWILICRDQRWKEGSRPVRSSKALNCVLSGEKASSSHTRKMCESAAHNKEEGGGGADWKKKTGVVSIVWIWLTFKTSDNNQKKTICQFSSTTMVVRDGNKSNFNNLQSKPTVLWNVRKQKTKSSTDSHTR